MFRIFQFLPIVLIGLFTLTSCEKEVEVIVDSAAPNGTFTAAKSGTFVEQNATGSKGAVKLGTDSKSVQFLQLGSDFSTNFGTGTVTVYLSTSKDFKADPMKGNPDLRLLGGVTKGGMANFKLDPKADAKFTHVILWCASANVPFGFAELK
jgi:Electron transfer DM13